MGPDFNVKVVDTLAKRAAFRCSNPACGIQTTGPNSDPEKATTIGEAAHIFGARPGSARFSEAVTIAARRAITNAIWLCRNCHRKVDADEDLYPTELLFKWREGHERQVADAIGARGDLYRHELEDDLVKTFSEYPHIVRRIVIDKPPGWEWRLTAELMRHLNRPIFRQLDDLRKGHYTRPLLTILDEHVLTWVQEQFDEMVALVGPLEGLINRLSVGWGEPGEPGDIEEIRHTCLLIRDHLKQILNHEERVRFVRTSVGAQRLVALLQDCIGSQADKLSEIPAALDNVVEMIGAVEEGRHDGPLVIQKTINIELPENWVKNIKNEMKNVSYLIDSGQMDKESPISSSFIFIALSIILFFIWLFY